MQVLFTLLFVLASFLPFSLPGGDYDELGSGADPLGNTLDVGEEPADGDLGSGADPLG